MHVYVWERQRDREQRQCPPCFVLLCFWDYNLVTTFLPSLSCLQTLPHSPPCSPSNSWPFYFLFFLTNYFKTRSFAFTWGSLIQLDCPTSPGLPSAGLIRTHQHDWFFSYGLWGLNPGPVFALTSSLPTRPSIIFWEKEITYSPLWMNVYILYTYTIYVYILFTCIWYIYHIQYNICMSIS